MEKTVYLVGAHDWSWGNTGDFIFFVFDDYEKAEKQAEWLENNLTLLDGDYITFQEFGISSEISHCGKGKTICDYLYDPKD